MDISENGLMDFKVRIENMVWRKKCERKKVDKSFAMKKILQLLGLRKEKKR